MGEEDGKWIGEWVYENEVRGRCVREDRDGMTVVYDENGEKRVEEWERLLWLLSCGMDPTIDFNTDSMVVYEIGAECTYGIMEWNGKCFGIDWSSGNKRVTMVDLDTKRWLCMRMVKKWVWMGDAESCMMRKGRGSMRVLW